MKFQSFFSLFVKSITTLFTKESQQCVVAQDGGLNYFRRLKKLKRFVFGRKDSKLKVRQQRDSTPPETERVFIISLCWRPKKFFFGLLIIRRESYQLYPVLFVLVFSLIPTVWMSTVMSLTLFRLILSNFSRVNSKWLCCRCCYAS